MNTLNQTRNNGENLDYSDKIENFFNKIGSAFAERIEKLLPESWKGTPITEENITPEELQESKKILQARMTELEADGYVGINVYEEVKDTFDSGDSVEIVKLANALERSKGFR